MKIFLTIAVIMSLVLMSVAVYGATSDETGAGASVTVNTFIDITLIDAGDAGFAFGAKDPSTTNNKEAAQTDGVASIFPAANITREATSNVDVKIRLKGLDFTGAGTIAVTNVAYDDDGEVDGSLVGLPQASLTNDYPVSAYATLTIASPNLGIWFWLDIPASQPAGAYTSTFSFKGTSS